MEKASSVYGILGDSKLKNLVKTFYQEVAKTPELRQLYPEDLSPAEERLYLFLVQVFGGPNTYHEQRGHPRLRMRHLKWPIDGAMRNKWVNCMLVALDKTIHDQNTREAMAAYFVQAANHMINQ